MKEYNIIQNSKVESKKGERVLKSFLHILKRIVIILVVFIILVLGIIEVYPRVADRSSAEAKENSTNWMASLDDSLLLGEISIPGVHDAGAYNPNLSLFSKCQDATTYELLNAGYRYLDIRLEVSYVCGEPILSICHGFVKCREGKTPFDSVLYLDKVLEECYEFLDNNPSETIIFVVKKEYGDEPISEFESMLASYTDNDYWLLTDRIPTLGEARGKIVLFRRYEDEAKLGKNSGILLDWSSQKDNSVTDLTAMHTDNDGLNTYVQDHYKYNADDKWSSFVGTIEETDDLLADKNAVVINFLSTNGTAPYGHPYKYAKNLNKRFLDYEIDAEKLGWVIVDFGTMEMAQKIYKQNFRE